MGKAFHFAFAGAAATALAVSTPTAAQTVAATVSGVIGGAVVPSPDCAQTFSVGATVECLRTGSDGAIFAGRARVDPGGRLRGISAAGHGGATTFTIGSAGTSWTDTIRFSPFAEPVTGRLFIRMTGDQSAATDGDGSALAAATLSFMRLGIYRDGNRLDPTAFDEVLLRRGLFDYGTFQLHRLGQEQVVRGMPGGFSEIDVPESRRLFDLVLSFEIEPGVSSIDFFWQFATNSTLYPGFSGQAQTRYFSTAAITGFQILGAGGNDLTGEAGITVPSGQDYPLGRPAGFGAVPEPSTWAMLVGGFGLMGGCLRRRRAATAAG